MMPVVSRPAKCSERIQSCALRSVYKYDDAGRQTQEIQSDKSDNVLHKIVYTYDSLGKQTGYAVYDGAGRLLARRHRSAASATPTKKKKTR